MDMITTLKQSATTVLNKLGDDLTSMQSAMIDKLPPFIRAHVKADEFIDQALWSVGIIAGILILFLELRRHLTRFRMSRSLGTAPGHAASVLGELLETERAYLKHLRTLSACRPKLPDELSATLAGVDALALLHNELLTTLTPDDKANPSPAAVAAAFLTLAPYLKAYSEYVGKQYERLAAVESMRGKSGGRDKLEKLQKAHGEPLESLLIKPIQRLCKYPLLLGALVKALPHSPARTSIAEALSLVEAVAAEVNSAEKQAEQAVKVLELGPAWQSLVAPTRRLTHSIDVDVSRTATTASGIPFTTTKAGHHRAYLFTDLLVLAEPVKRHVLERVTSQAADFTKALFSSPMRRVGGGARPVSPSRRGTANNRRSVGVSGEAELYAPEQYWQPKELFPLSELEAVPAPPDRPLTLRVRKRATAAVHAGWVELSFTSEGAKWSFLSLLQEALEVAGLQVAANLHRTNIAQQRQRVSSILRRDANESLVEKEQVVM